VYNLASVKRVASVTLIAVAMVLAAVAPSQGAGHGFRGGHPGTFHHGFGGHRDFNRGHFFIGHRPLMFWGYPYGYYPPAYGYSAPAYWYYCPSYGAYYPDVTSCPEAWVPIAAS
jgi:hypothetical protein